VEVTLHVRNFRSRAQGYRIRVHSPEGIACETAGVEVRAEPTSTASATLRLKIAPDAKPGTRLIALDTTVDGRRYGEWFDFMVQIGQ
jgi:hypothetical protein